jgi:hypothetical protein
MLFLSKPSADRRGSPVNHHGPPVVHGPHFEKHWPKPWPCTRYYITYTVEENPQSHLLSI